MKSIGTYFKRQLVVTIIGFIAVASILMGLYYFMEDYKTLYKDTSTIFANLNTIFTRGTIEDGAIEFLSTYIPQNKLKEFKEQGNLPALQEEARRLVPLLQDMRNEHLKGLLQLLELGILFIAPPFMILLLQTILSHRYITKLLRSQKNMILQFNETLLTGVQPFGTTAPSAAPPYKEMQEMAAFFERTMDIMNLVQELLIMDLGFSAEAFIDQFGTIFCSERYQHILPCDRFSLAIYQSSQNLLVAFHATVRGNKPVFLNKGFNQPLSETSLNKIIDQRIPYRIINNLEERRSISSDLLLKEGIHANITVPIIINQRLFGFLFFAHQQKHVYTGDMGKVASLVANIVRSRFFYSYAIQKTLSVFGDGIVNIVEFKDDETADHTRRVSLYAEVLADILRKQGRITPQKAEEIRAYAPLHDIGKIGIPDTILLKPAKLTSEEWNLMKQHPLIGGRLIKNANQQLINQMGFGLLHTAYNLIIDHHEWWDGSGYPQGKRGMDISIEGQIVAIADVFDALTTKRTYKPAFPFEQSLAIVQEQAGTHFNPELVAMFLDKREQILKIYQEHYVLG